MSSIVRLLNNRTAVWVAFLVALLSRYLLFFNCRLIDGDKSMQVAAAVNILKGKGYTLPVVSVNDFVTIQYIRITEWPPLYTYLLVPLLKITNMDIEASCYIMSVISITIFLGFFWRILIQLDFSYIFQFCLIIWGGFYIRAFVIVPIVTDFLAAGFFIGAFSYFLSALNNNGKREFFFAILLLIASAYTRYMYLSVVFIFPLVLIWKGYAQKNKRLTKTGLLVALICIITLSPLILQNYFVSGNLNDYWTKGFYFKNLLTFSPIFWDTFFDKELVIYQISNKTNTSYPRVVQIFSILNYIIIFALTAYFVKSIFSKRKMLISGNTYDNFFIVGGMLSLTIIFFLAYASFTNDVDWRRLGLATVWTYFAEDRYYMFIHFYLLLVVSYNCFNARNANKLASIWKKMLLFFVLLDISHGIWILIKTSINSRDKFTNVKWVEERERILDKLVSKSRKENFEPLFFMSYNYYFMAYTSIHDLKLCTDFEKFDEKNLRFHHPTQLYLIINSKAASEYYKPYIRNQGFELIEKMTDSSQIYTKRILLDDK